MDSLIVAATSQIVHNRIGSFANSMIISGTLNTTGMGCQAGDGNSSGKGYNETCTASGGAHGGFGGLGINYATRKIDKVLRGSIGGNDDKSNDSIC